MALGAACLVLLPALTAAALTLPGSAIEDALVRGLS
jgi:hypothetical protein